MPLYHKTPSLIMVATLIATVYLRVVGSFGGTYFRNITSGVTGVR